MNGRLSEIKQCLTGQSHFTVKIKTLDEALWSWSIKFDSQFGLTHGLERPSVIYLLQQFCSELLGWERDRGLTTKNGSSRATKEGERPSPAQPVWTLQ